MHEVYRPEWYSDEKAAEILQLLETGMSLSKLAQLPNMPSPQTVLRWVEKRPAFAAEYARARNAGLDAMADEVIEIADSTDAKNFQVDRLRFDARRWYLSKLAPKRYGERLELAGDKASPLTITVKREDIP